jgi:predicted ATPase
MITRLSLKNFKAFEDETFCLGRFNILACLNNSGKSSVIQALRLAAEQKPLTDLGPLREYIRSDFKSDSRGFDIECHFGEDDGHDGIRFSLMRNSKNPIGGETIPGIVSYLSADRFGSRNALPLNINDDTTTAGSKGENIVDFLSRLDDDWVDLRLPETFGQWWDRNKRQHPGVASCGVPWCPF